ncbi:MAG TPA: cyclopropane-fatty-acyl-phospholipid synthase family protein [Solirubrobacteraceae bacterium]|nr:cyclopropane-fatty-acyl-phospholipid synthase family protein [Solirubrobacteraceae bacterium]
MAALRTTEPLRRELAANLPERPFRVTFWDGSELPSTDGNGAPTLHVRSPRALGHALRAPGQLGIGRAYATGELEPDDLDALLLVLRRYQPPPIDRGGQLKLALAAARATGPMLPPPVPGVEQRPRGKRHSPERDKRSVQFHYDVSNEFFKLFLDESLTYSCAFFSLDDSSLEAAQFAKLELVCTKLALEPGMRVLDVGCGWGSFAIHAAREHGVQVTGITLSEGQAELARRRVADAGLSDKIEIRLQDYRALTDPPYDAISSIGMVEHVGSNQIDEYMRVCAGMLEPGARFLNHGIARLRVGEPEAGPFSERYVFPDAAPLHVSRIVVAMERAGLETEHVEGFRLDYAETLRHWARRLDENLPAAEKIAGPERLRVWRLYLRAARQGFETGFTSVFQVRCAKPK